MGTSARGRGLRRLRTLCLPAILAGSVVLGGGAGASALLASPPSVYGVTPNRGSTEGGTAVTILGTRFLGTSGVAFGTQPAQTFSVADDSTIYATSPPGPLGSVDIHSPLGIVVSSDQPILVEKPTYSSNPLTYGATDTLGYSPDAF